MESNRLAARPQGPPAVASAAAATTTMAKMRKAATTTTSASNTSNQQLTIKIGGSQHCTSARTNKKRRRAPKRLATFVQQHHRYLTAARAWPATTASGELQLPACLVVLLLLLVQLLFGGQPVEGAMNLPDGIENVLGFVPRSTFKCERDGYFGDIDNDCRIFHLCQRQVSASGRTEWRHWTYACGNQTMFNQLTLTCAFVDEAIPCRHASQFQYLNEVINRPSEPFLTDADVTSGQSYYSNRIMSDGARARAFQDSELMAQIGGGSPAAAAAAEGSYLASDQTGGRDDLASNEPQSLNSLAWPGPISAHVAVDLARAGSGEQRRHSSASNSATLAGAAAPAAEAHHQLNPGRNSEHSSTNLQSLQTAQWQPPAASAPNARPFAAGTATSQQQQSNSQFSFSIMTRHEPSAQANFGAAIFRQETGDGATRESAPNRQHLNVHHSSVAPPPPPPQQPQALQAEPTDGASTVASLVAFGAQSSTAASAPLGQAPGTTEPASSATRDAAFAVTSTATPTSTTTTTAAAATETPTTTLATTTTTRTAAVAAAAAVATTPPATTTTQPRQRAARENLQAQTRRSGGEQILANRRHNAAAFQSTRLSAARQSRNIATAAQQQQQQQQARPQQAALIMRKRSSRAAIEHAGAGAAATDRADFWRRDPASFQFAAPKFESLILRRRV